jgi:CheY-like chemotaxis protein
MTNPTILLVDDDPDDLLLLSDAIKSMDTHCELIEAYDGDAAVALLKELSNRGKVPDLIVLDINMPIMDGRELLTHLKRSKAFKDIPVVVYTTSSNLFDRLHCDQYHVELILKPNTSSGLAQTASLMLQYCKRRAA